MAAVRDANAVAPLWQAALVFRAELPVPAGISDRGHSDLSRPIPGGATSHETADAACSLLDRGQQMGAP